MAEPEPAPPQYMTALARANRVRVARATVKNRVRSREITAADVLREVPEDCRTMPLAELLIAQPQWGRVRVKTALGGISISERKALASITERQRLLIVELLR